MADRKKSWEEKFLEQTGKFWIASSDNTTQFLKREDLLELDASYCHAGPGDWEFEETPIKEKRKLIGTKMELIDGSGFVICKDIKTDQLHNNYTFIYLARQAYPHLSRVMHAHFDGYRYLHTDYARAKQLMGLMKASYAQLPHGLWDKYTTSETEPSHNIYLKSPDGELVCSLYTYLVGQHQQSMYNADFIRHFYFLFQRLNIMLEEYSLNF